MTPRPEDAPPPAIDLTVLTSAALPWRTGPSVFSIWHASGMAARGYSVRYVLPWLAPRAQARAWGKAMFATPDSHTDWLQAEALRLTGMALPPAIHNRATWFSPYRGILPLQDVYGVTPRCHTLMVHEPEHMCWYPFIRSRRRIPARVTVGRVMTNYEYYIAAARIPFARGLSRMVARAHHHVIRTRTDVPVRITPAFALPDMTAHDTRITGVFAAYADVQPVGPQTRGIYFVGKLIREKGLEDLLRCAARTGHTVDLYGAGEDEPTLRHMARQLAAPVRFLGPHASPWQVLGGYRVFFNPSLSEGLCTTTAEALVAGRNVVLPDCPGNLPFLPYPNTFFYDPATGPDAALADALRADPVPPEMARRDLDWHTACDRLAELCRLPRRPPHEGAADARPNA